MQQTQGLLFMQRFARPRNVSYEHGVWKISENNFLEQQVSMEEAVAQMMRGWLYIRKEPIPFDEKSFYGSSDHRIKNANGISVHGDYTFNLVIALPEKLRRSLETIHLISSAAEGSETISLAELPISTNPYWEDDHYKLSYISQYTIHSLQDYLVVYGGETRSWEPLKKLYYGVQIASIMELLQNQENSEGKKRGFRK